MRRSPVLLAVLTAVVLPGCQRSANRPVVIGAKEFTESVILAEMGTQLARHAGVACRRDDLGGTPALWRALTQGDIDAYLEYTGTISREILKTDPPDLAAALAAYGVRVSRSLGFRNNYAFGMRKDVALAIRSALTSLGTAFRRPSVLLTLKAGRSVEGLALCM